MVFPPNMAKKKIPYGLALPLEARDNVAPSIEGLGRFFVSSAKAYYDNARELRKRVPNGAQWEGTGATSDGPAGKPQAGSPDAGKIRAGTGSSLRAILTRKGRFGNTKLKPTTERKLVAKGFNVGKPTEVPRRSGQNKPKGQA